MRFLIFLTILLMSAISSCRSAKQVTVHTADSTRVEAREVKASISAEDVLTLIHTSTDIELSGITVEYYEPDTARPEARASPRRLTIDSARTRGEAETTRKEVATAVETGSREVYMERNRTELAETDTGTDILHPPARLIIFFTLCVIAIPVLTGIAKRRESG